MFNGQACESREKQKQILRFPFFMFSCDSLVNEYAKERFLLFITYSFKGKIGFMEKINSSLFRFGRWIY